jgi:hypothetical protein
VAEVEAVAGEVVAVAEGVEVEAVAGAGEVVAVAEAVAGEVVAEVAAAGLLHGAQRAGRAQSSGPSHRSRRSCLRSLPRELRRRRRLRRPRSRAC